MKDGFVRIGAACPPARLANPIYTAEEAIKLARLAAQSGVKVLAFPELFLTGATCADLFFQHTLIAQAQQALAQYMDATRDCDLLSVLGLPVAYGSALYNAAAVVCRGELLGLSVKTPDAQSPLAESRYFAPAPERPVHLHYAGCDTVLGAHLCFACTSMPSLVTAPVFGRDEAAVAAVCAAGATLLLHLDATPEYIGTNEVRTTALHAYTRRHSCVSLYVNAGESESGTDFLFSGARQVCDIGHTVAETRPFEALSLLSAEVDVERVLSERRKTATDTAACPAPIPFTLTPCETVLTRPPRRFPFVPSEPRALCERCALILDMQARALAARMERSHARCAVLGISGGLDSTLALLVAVRAMDMLLRDRSSVIAVTMPCFGTTERTKGNAEALTEQLGATLRIVDIKASVSRHFEDIGHDEDTYDVVYENAQARERTQVLMDIANAEGGLVVGTGDLSELALGWATYNGDHMSMYAVNADIPKTLIRHIVEHCAAEATVDGEPEVAATLRDVLATPVSPELLPPKDGEIAQCTEGLVGPYELHDYFLYHTVRYGYAPSKLLRLALATFRDVYDEQTIRAWLLVFMRRFFSQQFKRSCLPDGPKGGSVGLSPRGDFRMPSDADSSAWLNF